MTRTEDRLTAALESAAAAVPVENMRPLTAPGQDQPGRAQSRPRGAVTAHRYRRRAWLTALAAVASIAVISGALVALNIQASSPGPVQTAAYIGGSEPNVPAFFVDAGSTGLYDQKLRVVSLATGAVTATERAPAGTADITFLAEQAQTGNWVAAFINQGSGLMFYRFSITGTGKITPLTRINGVRLKQQPGNVTVLALSPDGSRLALSWTPDNIPDGAAFVNKVIVLNLRTGARQVWKDSLSDGAYHPLITSAVWKPSGRALVFASRMCKLNNATGPCFWEFRSLRTPPAGGRLKAGPVLLRQNGMGGVNQAPAISSDGSSVVEVRNPTSPGPYVTVVRIGLATGKQVVLHRFRAPGQYSVGANEGNFLIVGQLIRHGNNAVLRGWIDGRGFHSLRYPPNS
jgi:hypothetical protein